MTIRQAVDAGVNELAAAHTHNPEGCAKFLLRHILGEDPQKILLTRSDIDLSPEQERLYRGLLERRRLHEPVWYITNEAYFWEDTFYVDERVLIPRPETELLVEFSLAEMRRQMATRKSPLARQKRYGESKVTSRKLRFSLIDVGTGSGEIAISLAREMMEMREMRDWRNSNKRSDHASVKIYASDISADAIEVAKHNAKRIGVERFITFLVGDALDPLPGPVDLIVGNPPYVPTGAVGGLSYDIHHFEPREALDGGADGLDVHRKILKKAEKFTRSGGAIFLEIGHDQGEKVRKIAAKHFPAAKIEIIKDYDNNDRVLSITNVQGRP